MGLHLTEVRGLTVIGKASTDITNVLISPRSVTADTEILSLTTKIENNHQITLMSLQASFANAGKLYLVDENDNRLYLTDAATNYPAKMLILVSWMTETDEVWSLRYSETTTMYSLKVVHSGLF